MFNQSVLLVPEQSNQSINKKKVSVLLEIFAAFLPLFILGIIGTVLGGATIIGTAIINFGYLLSILAASVVLRRHGTGWREIGMARPENLFRTIILGIGTAAAALVMILVLSTLATKLPGSQVAEADISRFNPLEGNLPLLITSVVLAWTAVAFGEEMLYRAFLINQLGILFHSKRLRWTLSLIFSSTFFGLVHFYQGPLGIVLTGLTGLLFGLIYLKSSRNLWAVIIAHGLMNTFTFVLVFLGMA
jgi:membrane protease YdiL (CAAX protease family)